MKNPIFVSLIILGSLGFMSCGDSEDVLDGFVMEHNQPIRLTTTSTDNFNSWRLDDETNFTTAIPNDYSSWMVYFSDGGGSLSCTTPGNVNSWEGTINGKQTLPITSTLRTTVQDDFNEWVYESSTMTYYIRTNERDNLGDVKIYNSANTYICEVKTAIKGDMNKWKYIDYQNMPSDESMFIDFLPVILIISQYY